MDKEIRYFVNGYEMLLYLSGDREERKSVDCFELQDFESEEEAVAAARDFISEHKNAVNDQKHGIGSVTYWVAVVERAVEDAVMGWLPCDRDGVTEDEEGMVPDDAAVAYISTLDGSREERAFELAKHDYYGFLDYKEDRYTTVYGYIFAAQVCAIYVVILLSGLLVFWSAIFIDSKGRKFSRQEDSRILRKHHREIGKTMAINRVTIMGNLTRDAELRKKGDATSVLTFGLAINEKKKDSETGEYVDAPVFVDCALFGARAEALAPYLTKGKKVSVDGRLRYHSWMKNDEKRHALSVLVTDIEFADSKGAGKDTVSAQGQSTEPETYDADIPF